jgi:phosphopantothenoylcysteine decarboxylase/phosphopantothenate--cysteine ligase
MLNGKKILLGITGGIAAYKAANIVRLLVKAGAEVRVVMTPSARDFITPLTMATLSKHPVLTEAFDTESGSWNSHIDLGIWADIFLIAPATANTIAKMASGIADNLLLTTYLSARGQVFIAPSMDVDMLEHVATSDNIGKLEERNVKVIQPGTGELASGLEGKGRMAEPEEIVKVISDFLKKKSPR